jgi:hypothetical protein
VEVGEKTTPYPDFPIIYLVGRRGSIPLSLVAIEVGQTAAEPCQRRRTIWVGLRFPALFFSIMLSRSPPKRRFTMELFISLTLVTAAIEVPLLLLK